MMILFVLLFGVKCGCTGEKLMEMARVSHSDRATIKNLVYAVHVFFP